MTDQCYANYIDFYCIETCLICKFVVSDYLSLIWMLNYESEYLRVIYLNECVN